jgi:hypothetical protein
LNAEKPKIDVLRRNLQRAYVDHLRAELIPAKDGGFFGDSGGSDFRAVARVALGRLKGQIEAGASRTQDSITAAHLQDCAREIEVALESKK